MELSLSETVLSKVSSIYVAVTTHLDSGFTFCCIRIENGLAVLCWILHRYIFVF